MIKAAFVFAMLLQLLLRLPISCAEQLPSLSPGEELRQGERMYREGILPSGAPMRALRGDLTAPGTTFSCVSCHLRSGLGSVEEGIYTPAANGARLFSPLQLRYLKYGDASIATAYFAVPIERPPYSDAAVAKAIREGIDPAGRRLDDIMPRFQLGDGEVAALVSYLKSLSSQYSPGYSAGTVRLATVITEEVSEKERAAMLDPLMRFVTAWNNKAGYLRRLAESGNLKRMGNMMPPPSDRVSLSLWLLKGAPETWRRQLEEYYRKEPVFALIGGISKGEWRPVHDFSEEHAIPSLFPDTDFPVISKHDWYTLYLSRGYHHEGETAARYLHSVAETLKGRGVLQVVRDSLEGRTLAAGFAEAWRDLGEKAPVTLTLKAGDEVAEADLRSVLGREQPSAVLLWDGPAALEGLEALLAGPVRPELVMASSSYVGDGFRSVKEGHRSAVHFTYPLRLSAPLWQKFPANMTQVSFSGSTKAATLAFAIEEVLTAAFADMRGEYYRDRFLDVIGMMEGVEVPLYERITFGASQRYASKGCYVVQLSGGDKPELIRKNNWLTGEAE